MNVCKKCNNPVSLQSNFCGYCGTILSSYELTNNVTRKIIPKLENNEYKIGIEKNQTTVSFSIQNTGLVAIALYIVGKSKNPDSFLNLHEQKLAQETINILPGEEESIDIPVNKKVIDEIFQQIDDKSQKEDRFIRLIVYTSRFDSKKQEFENFFIDFHPIPKLLTFERTHRIIRFLDRSELRECTLSLQLNNLDIETQIFRTYITCSDWEEHPYIGNTFSTISNSPDVFTKIDSQKIFKRDPSLFPLTLQILERKGIEIPWNHEAIPETGLCIFSTKIQMTSVSGKSLTAYIAGVIGSEPELILQKHHVIETASEIYKISLRNNGDLPLFIDTYEVLDNHGEKIPKNHQFIKLNHLEKERDGTEYQVQMIDTISPIGPKQESWFHMEFDERQKMPSEKNIFTLFRTLRLYHYNAKGLYTDIKLTIQTEKTNMNSNASLVIDFGTSSSMVQVVNTARTDGKNMLPLDLEEDVKGYELESILLYPEQQDQDDHIFIFGEEAKNQINIYPHNVVQSLKTIVNENPDRLYEFKKVQIMNEIGETFLVEIKAQDLLQRFIQALKERSEEAYRNVPQSELDQLGLERNLIFDRAIFTHPVDIKEFEQLHIVSQNVGLNPYKSKEEFKENSCIDESSAALISYIFYLFQQNSLPEHFAEKIICIDIGGGTTDISLAEVTGDAKNPPYHIGLYPSVGDSKLGGDAIDKLFSCDLIQICSPDDPNNTELFELACRKDSFKDFKSKVVRKNSKITSHMLESYWNTAISLRAYAEHIKIELSNKNRDSVHKNLTKLHEDFNETEVSITKAHFEKIIQPLMQKLTKILDLLLQRSSYDKSDITTVLLTGKSSFIPKIQDTITEYFSGLSTKPHFVFPDLDASDGFHPKDCVSQGAAIWATFKGDETFHIYEKDICPMFTYGRGFIKSPIFTNANKENHLYRRTINRSSYNSRFSVYENGKLYHTFNFSDVGESIIEFDIVYDKPNLYVEIGGDKIYKDNR
jgi:hypothetical protein